MSFFNATAVITKQYMLLTIQKCFLVLFFLQPALDLIRLELSAHRPDLLHEVPICMQSLTDATSFID